MTDTRRLFTALSKGLDNVIGTKEEVDTRRRSILALNQIKKVDIFNSILTGSKAEGFDFSKSDEDRMHVANHINVLDFNESTPTSDKSIYLRMIYDPSSCGYVLLELVSVPSQHKTDLVLQSAICYKKTILVSSSLYISDILEVNMQKGANDGYLFLGQNGPSLKCTFTYSNGNYEFDYVPSFYCASWPLIANEWTNRKRKYGWPSKRMINYIVNSGCHLVAVGDTLSDNSLLQWRISFVVAENKLIHSLNHVQFKVYGLMKLFLSDVLKPDLNLNEPVVCSYSIKTVLMWSVENSPLQMWTTENILECFCMCFNLLIECVEKGNLPSYFVPGNNLFKKRLYGSVRCQILNLFYKYRKENFQCLTRSPSLKIILQNEGCYGRRMCSTRCKEAYMEARCDKIVFKRIPNLLYSDGTSESRGFSLSCKYLISESDILCCLAVYKITMICATKASEIMKRNFYIRDIDNNNNKVVYTSTIRARNYILFGTGMDLSFGWLHLATYNYILGRHNLALEICQNVARSVVSATLEHGGEVTSGTYMRRFCGRGLSILEKLKTANWNVFKIDMLFPLELILEIATNLDRVYAQPITYALFLSFMCHHHLGNEYNKHVALLELQAVLKDERNSYRFYVINNMVGICHELVGDYRSAAISYMSSLCKCPNHAAALRFEHVRRFL